MARRGNPRRKLFFTISMHAWYQRLLRFRVLDVGVTVSTEAASESSSTSGSGYWPGIPPTKSSRVPSLSMMGLITCSGEVMVTLVIKVGTSAKNACDEIRRPEKPSSS